ncbi:MAG: inositol monophosphatase [Clostridia bacterium]|nr:inositol monophosphatase [Clostridia bacterium]
MSWREELKNIARETSPLITRRPGEVLSKEGHANFVTDIDLSIQAQLKKRLSALVPGSHFIGEESENELLGGAPTWIVDPVDGTTNLIHDCRWSAVSIALCEGRQPCAGLIWQPYTGEMFFAEAGKGAFLNDAPIRVSQNALPDALVAFGTAPYNAELSQQSMRAALCFLTHCADIRRAGSAALDLAYVACGRADIYFELILKPWDYAAGALLVKEAGGCFMTPFEGGKDSAPVWDRPAGVFASNAVCREQALALLMQSSGQN